MPAFGHDAALWERGARLALSSLVGLGRRTVTGMLTTCGHHDRDWSADYRLFERGRFDVEALFTPALKACVQRAVELDEPLVVALDDTLVRKRGRTVSGTAWRRDPLGPKFQTNLVWGQRFLQASLLWPQGKGAARARAVPVAFESCPSAAKLRATANDEERERHRAEAKALRLPRRAAEVLSNLHTRIAALTPGRRLIATVDGGFTNGSMFGAIPPNTVLVGRARKDAKLFSPPLPRIDGTRGRPRNYGALLPTPEQVRQNAEVPWQSVEVWAAGKKHSFDVKAVGPVRWKSAGARDLQLVVVRPLGYRLTTRSRQLFREPAYLLCSEPDLALATVLQAYVWRWEIEVNFRDEKTLLGVGDAQVRTPTACRTAPAITVAAYATLLAAIERAEADGIAQPLIRPRWNPHRKDRRITTRDAQTLLRHDLWASALKRNFEHFTNSRHRNGTMSKFRNSFVSALLFASN